MTQIKMNIGTSSSPIWKNIDLNEGAGEYSHQEGNETQASGNYSHAEGQNTEATGTSSHSEGSYTKASGAASHSEGWGSQATSEGAHAEGEYTQATGKGSHAEGQNSVASGWFSHAGGSNTTSIGYASRAIGEYTRTTSMRSLASGYYTTANIDSQTVIGEYNVLSNISDSSKEIFVIGNGTSDSNRGNAFKVRMNGQTYADGAYSSAGADYAEYFEWIDGNLEDEDRKGYFVTLDGEMIRKANGSDDYILGVVSATPSVIGNNYESWKDKYVTNEWGEVQYEEVIVPAVTKTFEVKDQNGNITEETIELAPEKTNIVPIVNSDWDSQQEYTSREKRKEWSPIGLVGKLLVRDDGTCEVNKYCKPNDEGIATISSSGYRVMKRVSSNIILVLVK